MINENPLEIIVAGTDEFIQAGIDLISSLLKGHDKPGVILPVGNTMREIYDALPQIDIRYIQLDEVVGTNLFRDRIDKQLLKRINCEIDPHFTFDGKAENLEQEAQSMEEEFSKNPANLSILGLGKNGHIGYNEPGSAPDSKTRIVELTQESRNALNSYWPDKNITATHGLTLGLGTLAKAEKTLLVINHDPQKTEAAKKTLHGPIDPEQGGIPAAAVRTFPNVTVLIHSTMWDRVRHG